MSDNSRTLADYGIGGDSSGDGIIIYLVKGSAANTGVGGGGGGAAVASVNSTTSPASSATRPNLNSGANNPFLNFGAANNNNFNNNNPRANLMSSMGGMPDIATFQQELMNNPQMMSEMMNNPMVSVCFIESFQNAQCLPQLYQYP